NFTLLFPENDYTKEGTIILKLPINCQHKSGRVRETVSVSRMESAERALPTRGKLQVSKHLC
ncbi:hypothetical protein, partial [Anaerotignum faecicola]